MAIPKDAIGKIGAAVRESSVTTGLGVVNVANEDGTPISGVLRSNKVVEQTQISASTAETTIVAAGGSGIFKDLYGLILANTGASATKVTIKDDTAGTTRAVIYVPAGETRGFMLPSDSGIPQAVANKVWTATCGTSTTALEVTALTTKNS